MLNQFVNVMALALPGVVAWGAGWIAVRRFFDHAVPRMMLLGSAVGTVAAAVLSVLRRATNWINRELVSLCVLPALLIVSVMLVVWMWRSRDDRLSKGVVACVLAGAFGALLTFLELPDVFLQTVGFVTPGGSWFSTEMVINLTGYALGLGTVAAVTGAVFRSSRLARVRAQKLAITVVLAMAAVTQVTMFAQILLARRIIVHSGLFRSVVWVLNNETWFSIAMLVCALAPVMSAINAHRSRDDEPNNPAEARIRRAGVLDRRRFLTLAVAGVSVAVASSTVGRRVVETKPTLSPPEPYESDADSVWVPLEAVTDGHLHRYAYETTDGVEVRFIVIQKNANAFGVGLDACEICGPSGYYEKNGQVICELCDVAMNINTIGIAGGCNPIPVNYTVAGCLLKIARADLESQSHVFA